MRLSDTIVLFSQFQQNRKGELILTYNPNSTAKLTAEMLGFTQEELDSMSYYWTSKDVNGGILIENSNTFELDNIQVVNIVDYKTFQCQVSIPSQDIVLATLEKTIYNTFDDTDYEVFFEVSEGGTYTYDTFGDLYPPQIYEKPITGHTIGFTLSENIGTYSYKWIFPQNSLIITPDGTEPIIGTYYAASENEQSNVVNFVIDTRYDYTKALNNRIQLEITIDKKPRLFYFDIGFIKEGDPGTNGTSLSMKISPTTGSPVTLTPGGQIQLQADIWFNGQPITESNYFNFETSFPRAYKVNNPLIEGGVSIVKNNNIITISDVVLEASVLYDAATGLVENYNSIIQIKAVPNQNGKDAGFNYDVIGLYGIPISNDVDMANSSCRGIKNVIYDSDGHNPSYGKIPFELNDLEPQIIESSTAIRELKNNIVIPRDKFFEDQSRGGIIFRYNDNMNYFISPIVFMANAYSKEILNAWDGSSVDINEEGGYIMAPQIGAGKKNKDNTFTGVLMGVYVNGDEGSHHGLYGFQDGITSFGFKDDGTAFIGKAGTGRIEFDGTFGTITSGNYIKGVSGTRIDLSKGWIDSFNFRLTSKALDLNSENSRFKFDISQDSNGTFKIIGSDKTLLNITNESYYLQSNNFSEGEAGMKINLKNGSIDAKNFSISSSGDASFKGDIEADSGTIGDWVINGGRLESTNGSIKLDAKNNRIIGGSIYIPDIRGSLFSVDEDGKLIATNANISGTINADDGTIGGWYIGDEWIQSMEDKPSNLQNFISLKKGNNAHIQIGAGILYPDSVTLRIVTPSGVSQQQLILIFIQQEKGNLP